VACAASKASAGMVNICLTICSGRAIPMPMAKQTAADDAAGSQHALAHGACVTRQRWQSPRTVARLINPVRRIEARPDPDVEERETIRARASARIPAGGNRQSGIPLVGGHPRFSRARGAWLWDADGKRYIDYVGSWGPALVGMRTRRSFGGQDGRPSDYRLARRPSSKSSRGIAVRVAASLELVRLVSSGTEATMTAIRLARGYTGRSRIIKFEKLLSRSCRQLLVKAGSGALTFRRQPSSRCPADVSAQEPPPGPQGIRAPADSCRIGTDMRASSVPIRT